MCVQLIASLVSKRNDRLENLCSLCRMNSALLSRFDLVSFHRYHHHSSCTIFHTFGVTPSPSFLSLHFFYLFFFPPSLPPSFPPPSLPSLSIHLHPSLPSPSLSPLHVHVGVHSSGQARRRNGLLAVGARYGLALWTTEVSSLGSLDCTPKNTKLCKNIQPWTQIFCKGLGAKLE